MEWYWIYGIIVGVLSFLTVFGIFLAQGYDRENELTGIGYLFIGMMGLVITVVMAIFLSIIYPLFLIGSFIRGND